MPKLPTLTQEEKYWDVKPAGKGYMLIPIKKSTTPTQKIVVK